MGPLLGCDARGVLEDAKHLEWLREKTGKKFAAGIVLHTGPRTYRLGSNGILAMPISCLWDAYAARRWRLIRHHTNEASEPAISRSPIKN
jgi:hypothetical protein